jgi:DNA-binding transcriptional LysR family regulator
LNIAAIQTFLCVVRTHNLNVAAVELNVTQSAVTARLDTLEQTLGQKLLFRSRKGASLTKAGFAFLDQAEIISQSWETAKSLAKLREGLTGLFSFCCDPTLWQGLGQTWIEDTEKQNPDFAIEVWSGETTTAMQWLQSGLCDVALLTEPLLGEEINSREFSKEKFLLVSTQLREAMAWDLAYVYVDYGSAVRRQHAIAWPGDETARMTFSNPEWALDYLLTQGGSAYLPQRLAGPLIASGQLFYVEAVVEFERATYLSWRRAVEPSFPWLISAHESAGE